MSSVMIRCPTTGKPVSTEIEIEPSVFRQLPEVESHMLCPACGQDHAWVKSSAWLENDLRLVDAQFATGARG